MGWATGIHACTTSASPPPEGSLPGARSPAPNSRFLATGTQDFPAHTAALYGALIPAIHQDDHVISDYEPRR
jgi:hypothetical protein